MENKIWKFNKGEWSEAYVFLKLLCDGRIYGATEDFKRDLSRFIDILNILRTEKTGVLKFERNRNHKNPFITAFENDVEFAIITKPELSEKADFLYREIKNAISKKSFEIEEITEFLQKLKFSSPKMPNLPKEYAEFYGNKTDIIMTIIDSYDKSVSTDGFSIKSHMGQPSTLFNSGDGSRLIYRINNCTDLRMNEINAIESEMGIIQAIKNDSNLSLEFVKTGKDVFSDNLQFIDTRMIEIINTAVLIQVQYLDDPSSNDLKDIVEMVSKYNPLNIKRPEQFYTAKFKNFLFATLAGLTASREWDGKVRMTGGYIDVGKDGELFYYRAISNEIFCSYLYENTYIDRPSRGVNKDLAIAKSKAALQNRTLTEDEIIEVTFKDGKKKDKKGNWGYIFKEGNSYYIAINWQIRFR